MEQTLAGALRAATKNSHHAIDHHPLLSPLAKADITLTQYRRVLQTFGWIYHPLQQHLIRSLKHLQIDKEYQISPRHEWLAVDLDYYGADLHANPNPLRAWFMPEIEDVAGLIGMLYVVEGSTLGGQVLLRRLNQTLGITADKGGCFFAGHGEETQQRWGEFMAIASRFCPPEQQATVCKSAVICFSLLNRMLTVADYYWNAQDEKYTIGTIDALSQA